MRKNYMVVRRRDIKIIILLILVFTLFSSQLVFAMTAESSNYSVARFGTGVQASNLSSIDLQARFVLLASAGTPNAKSNSFITNIGFWNNTSYRIIVSINSYSILPSSAVAGSTIGLYISALNSENVWAKITSPNAQEQTLNLINGQTVNYLPSPSVIGRYKVTFYANSSTRAIASVVDYFELTEQTTPLPPQNGGSGEGTTKVIEKCTINWDCTPWSICVDGKQKRSCENIGNCIGENNKPNEEIACSEVLFDISLKLNNINLTQSKNLLFDLNLSENLSGEEIDVHIKYSILDEENNEIFSQIETKAIKEKLNIHKTIDEVILEDGIYTLRTDILYGNLQRAFAEQKFRVFEGEMDLKIPPLTGRVTGDTEFDGRNILITFIISATTILLILTFYNYRKKIFPFFKSKKHKKNSLIGLLNKRVYCGEGNLIGKVEEINIGKNKIDSIVVILDRKKKKTIKYKGKRIGIKYSDVKVVGNHILIVDKRIMEKL